MMVLIMMIAGEHCNDSNLHDIWPLFVLDGFPPCTGANQHHHQQHFIPHHQNLYRQKDYNSSFGIKLFLNITNIRYPRTRWRIKWKALQWSLGLSRLKKTTIWISIESLMKMFFFYIFLTICMIKWSQVITIRLHGYTYFKSYIFMID